MSPLTICLWETAVTGHPGQSRVRGPGHSRELRLMTHPFVLGTGERLFRETSARKPVRLVEVRAIGDNLALLTYQPVGNS
jgi:hypothetical protein